MTLAAGSARARRAARLRAPRWRDPRLLIGALLVLASLAATVLVVRGVAQTTRVWAAAVALVPGAEVAESALVPVEVKLPDSAAAYIPSASAVAPGTTVRAAVVAGELLPRSVLVSLEDLSGRVVSVGVSAAPPDAVAAGSAVDVWAADPGSAETAEPEEILSGAEVISVDRGGSELTASGPGRIEVYVPDGEIGALVRAQAAGHHISVVAVPRAGRASAHPAEQAPDALAEEAP
ncbi:hypothetical protein [Brevibacterium album]|uniref:hypothetical protein n=1 Tax=Brevibacterium album TaxID=417948 RepID=UPI00041F7C22|nr:hypothetical protein [Brevibacterium album]